MRLSFGLACFAIASTGAAAVGETMAIRGNTKSANKLMQHARRLQNNNYYNGQYGGGQYGGGQYGGYYYNRQGGGGENQNGFLYDYSIKLLTCTAGEPTINYENGDVESSTVVFRLCPVASCNATASAFGCEEGYGDYSVGLNTFVEAYMEGQRDNYNSGLTLYNKYGQEFNVEEYRECREFEQEGQQQNNWYNNYNNYNGDYNNDNNNQGGGYGGYYLYQQVYIGPACTADGTSIRLGMFYDKYCSYEAAVTFGSLAYGWDSLPYGDGGLVPNQCMTCVNYKWELSEMCQKSFESSSSRCEEHMQSYSYYGQNTYGCDYIDALVSAVDLSSNLQQMVSQGENSHTFNVPLDEEQEIEIAIFVIMSIVGAALACCIINCVRCRKVRKHSKVDNSYYEVHQPVLEIPDGPEMKRRVSSIAQLVRSGTFSMKEATLSAAATTKLVLAETAAKAVAAVRSRSNLSKSGEEQITDGTATSVEGLADTQYAHIEEDQPAGNEEDAADTDYVYTTMETEDPITSTRSFEKDTIKKMPLVITGSYRAPSPTPVAAPEVAQVKTGMLVSLDEPADGAVSVNTGLPPRAPTSLPPKIPPSGPAQVKKVSSNVSSSGGSMKKVPSVLSAAGSIKKVSSNVSFAGSERKDPPTVSTAGSVKKSPSTLSATGSVKQGASATVATEAITATTDTSTSRAEDTTITGSSWWPWTTASATTSVPFERVVSSTPASEDAKGISAAEPAAEAETSSDSSPPVIVTAEDASPSKPESESKAAGTGSWFPW
jgi:hypothetical protein